MVQKKVCMIGVYGTGKTSLVQQFVHAKFSERYRSTVGVSVERKAVQVDGTPVNLLLWDLTGQRRFQRVQRSYIRGSAGVIFVVDGTRRDTLDELAELRALVHETAGAVPAVYAFNKADLADLWRLADEDAAQCAGERRLVLKTSAKTGKGVEAAFHWLAEAMLADRGEAHA